MNTAIDSQTHIKKEISSMIALVSSQWNNCKASILKKDTKQIKHILDEEKTVNAFEIKIDRSCEKYLALHTPVAIDLRFVLSVIKTNTYLERIGDNIEGIAKNLLLFENDISKEMLEQFSLDTLISTLDEMFLKIEQAFDDEDTNLAIEVKSIDKIINNIDNENVNKSVELMQKHPENVRAYLLLLSISRKIERAGDLIKNIAEEIVFYREAKILKHKGKKAKKSDVKDAMK